MWQGALLLDAWQRRSDAVVCLRGYIVESVASVYLSDRAFSMEYRGAMTVYSHVPAKAALLLLAIARVVSQACLVVLFAV
jgi:hypothetical protein